MQIHMHVRTLMQCGTTVLSRVRSFLPQMESANKELEDAMRERPREEFDIESVPEGSHHIEMVDLAPSSLALA